MASTRTTRAGSVAHGKAARALCPLDAQAQPSVLAPYTAASEHDNQGQRVVTGQRLMQTASDILLGWVRDEAPDGRRTDYFVRQLRDWKMSADVEGMAPASLAYYGRMCAATLARAHARAGDRFAIAGYLGKSAAFETAVTEFAEAYARLTERDHAALQAAVDSGRATAADQSPPRSAATGSSEAALSAG